MRRGVLFIGVMTGTCLVVLAYSDGFHPALPAVPHLIGVTLAAVLVWLVMAAAVTWLAELLRRHHKALAGHAVRHGKRGTIAAARMAGNGGRSAASRLASWAGPRWAARVPVTGGMGWATPEATRERVDGRLSDAQRERDANGQENVCAACGHDGTPGDPLVIAGDGFRVHTSETTDPESGYYNPAQAARTGGTDEQVRAEVWRLRRKAELANLRGNKTATDELETRACDLEATIQNPSPAERYRMDAWPRARAANAWLEGKGPRPAWLDEPDEPHNPAGASAPDGTSPNGETTMASRINPDRRAHRAASLSGGKVPSEWGAVVATAADFEPEDDAHLLNWLSDQVQGIGAYAEGLIEAYETAINSVGLDPKGLATLHDVADAAAHCAEIMNAAKHKFTEYYELPREFAANGGLAPHDGRWVTGEGG